MPTKPRGTVAKFGLHAGQRREHLDHRPHRLDVVAPLGLDLFRGRGSEADELLEAELVGGEVVLDAEAGEHVVADDAVQLDAGQAHAVHAVDLHEVLDARLHLVDLQPALDLERVERTPALIVESRRPTFLASGLVMNTAGAPVSRIMLNGPFPLILARTRTCLVSVSL